MRGLTMPKRVKRFACLHPNICTYRIAEPFTIPNLTPNLQWALNFTLPDQYTLIFVCTCRNHTFSSGSHHSLTVSFLAIIPLAKVCSTRLSAENVS